MKLHLVFLRGECVLPEQLSLLLKPFSNGWNLTEAIAEDLDVAIRGAGWHFIWLMGSFARLGFGKTREAAIQQAVESALKKVTRQCNASELESVEVARYPGFHLARATVQARQIQQDTSMVMAGA